MAMVMIHGTWILYLSLSCSLGRKKCVPRCIYTYLYSLVSIYIYIYIYSLYITVVHIYDYRVFALDEDLCQTLTCNIFIYNRSIRASVCIYIYHGKMSLYYIIWSLFRSRAVGSGSEEAVYRMHLYRWVKIYMIYIYIYICAL